MAAAWMWLEIKHRYVSGGAAAATLGNVFSMSCLAPSVRSYIARARVGNTRVAPSGAQQCRNARRKPYMPHSWVRCGGSWAQGHGCHESLNPQTQWSTELAGAVSRSWCWWPWRVALWTRVCWDDQTCSFWRGSKMGNLVDGHACLRWKV